MAIHIWCLDCLPAGSNVDCDKYMPSVWTHVWDVTYGMQMHVPSNYECGRVLHHRTGMTVAMLNAGIVYVWTLDFVGSES